MGYHAGSRSPNKRELNNYLTPPKPDEMESDNEDRSGTSTNPRPHENKYKQFAKQPVSSTIEVSRHARLRASKG